MAFTLWAAIEMVLVVGGQKWYNNRKRLLYRFNFLYHYGVNAYGILTASDHHVLFIFSKQGPNPHANEDAQDDEHLVLLAF